MIILGFFLRFFVNWAPESCSKLPSYLLSVCYKLLERLILRLISPTVEALFNPN